MKITDRNFTLYTQNRTSNSVPSISRKSSNSVQDIVSLSINERNTYMNGMLSQLGESLKIFQNSPSRIESGIKDAIYTKKTIFPQIKNNLSNSAYTGQNFKINSKKTINSVNTERKIAARYLIMAENHNAVSNRMVKRSDIADFNKTLNVSNSASIFKKIKNASKLL